MAKSSARKHVRGVDLGRAGARVRARSRSEEGTLAHPPRPQDKIESSIQSTRAPRVTAAERLLKRIDARRAAIQARRGTLSESYLLIREDRER